MQKENRFGIGSGPGEIRLRYLLLAPFVVYGVFNLVTLAMIMAGAQAKADPFWHAPVLFLFGS